MRIRTFAALFTAAIILGTSVHLNATQITGSQTTVAPADDSTKKLGAFVGKWETEGAFTSGQKTSTSLECRWSPQGSYLVCDQLVNMGTAGDHRQFTVYSYDSKSGNYSYTTLSDPGAKPSTGGITIKAISGLTIPALPPMARPR
jgi:hypothetical protein